MSGKLDMLPYQIWKQLKTKYPVKTILVTDDDLTSITAQMYRSHRKYLERRFFEEGVIIKRWAHDYDSLSTVTPKLGLVYLANDSVIVPGIEVHALIGHNAYYKDTSGVMDEPRD